MGVQSVLNRSPIVVAREYLEDREEHARKAHYQRRVRLYRDDVETLTKSAIGDIFDSPTTKARLGKFAKLAAAQSLFKQVVRQIARPVYAVPPVRTLKGEVDAELALAYRGLVASSRLNRRMDLTCRLANACNHVFVYSRYVPRLKRIVREPMTPDMVTVIPDPEDPYTELAIIYDRRVRVRGAWETWHVYWDDEIAFQLNERHELMPFTEVAADNTITQETIRRHGMGIMPFVPVRLQEPFGGCYWDMTEGEDLVAADEVDKLLHLLSFRLLKARGFKQIVAEGGSAGLPKGQQTDEETVLITEGDTKVSTLDTQSDAAHYIALQQQVRNAAAASRGLSRARMNQEQSDGSDDVGLHEQRAESVLVMHDVEQRQFAVDRVIAREAGVEIPEDVELEVDFGEVQFRADPMGTLALWKELRSMGLRNVRDDVKALNPEIRDDEAADEEIAVNLEVESNFIQARRALNMPADANVNQPGQSPIDNGSLGPAVRDGRMTAEQAALLAAQGPDPHGMHGVGGAE